MSQNIEQTYRTQMILWVAFLMSQFIFIVVLFVSKSEIFKFDFTKPMFEVMAIVLALVAIISFALSFVYKNKYLKQAIEKQEIPLVQESLIMAFAFCEAICIFGLVLAFSDYQYFFAWFVLGIAGILIHIPKRSYLIDASYRKDSVI